MVMPLPSDPKNTLMTPMTGYATGIINGRFFSGPIYVDARGYVRVRLPAVLPPPARPLEVVKRG